MSGDHNMHQKPGATEMTDRELLELAAKAAQIDVYWGNSSHQFIWKDKEGGHEYPEPVFWNPLTDDGDALRLWVKLKLDISFGDVSFFDDDFGFPATYWREAQDAKRFVRHENDPYAATRRAIVRAAAEIGKEMK